jgi:branched-chain amino acid transport system permease protein
MSAPAKRLLAYLAALALVPLLDSILGLKLLPAACQTLIYLILAQGLNVVVGFAGLLHLGFAAFFAVGAFSMAYLTSPQSPVADYCQWGFWPALASSVVISALAGAALATPVLRLRGDYLAIVTMGFGLMLDPILRNFDETTKAIAGLSAIASPTLGSWTLTSQNASGWFYFLFLNLVVVIGLCSRLRHSRLGSELRAQREDAIAAAACGISVARAKLLAFVVGGSIAGLAGSLYASYIYTLNLSFPLDFNGSIMVLAMVILGGIGSIEGALVGGLALSSLNLIVTPKLIDWINITVRPPLFEALTGSPKLWATIEPFLDLSKAQYLLFGGTLVLMMRWRPQGLLPEQPVDYHSEGSS